MSKNLWAVLIILLVVAIGVFLAYRSYSSTQTSSTPTQAPTNQQNSLSPEPTMIESTPSAQGTNQNVVSVTESAFDPKIITVKVGAEVVWLNKDTKTHNVSSDPHPQHTQNTFMNLGGFAAGKSVSQTFAVKGTFKYHDHLSPTLTGTVVVE